MKQFLTKIPVRKLLAVLFWLILALICWSRREYLTIDGILNFTPENPFLAMLIMLGLFVLKGITFVIYGNILYAATGILFPLPAEIVLVLVSFILLFRLRKIHKQPKKV